MTGTWPAPGITTSLEPGIAWVAISALARGMTASSSPWTMRVGSRTPSSLSATRSGPHRAARAYPDSVGGLAGQRSSCAPLCGPGEATRRTVKPAATMNVPLWILVVGAGSAGAALAARLLEQASARVLLVEADPDYRTVDTPPEIQSLNWPESPAPRPLLAGTDRPAHRRSSARPRRERPRAGGQLDDQRGGHRSARSRRIDVRGDRPAGPLGYLGCAWGPVSDELRAARSSYLGDGLVCANPAAPT